MRSIRRLAAWIVVAAATASCGGGGGTEPAVETDGGAVPALVALNPPSSTLSIGAQLPLQAVVQDPEGKTIPVSSMVWTVQDPSIATVSSAGVVTAVALGNTQVAASYNGKSAVAAITVQKTPVASVVVAPGQATAVVGGRTPFTAEAYDASQNRLADRGIIWSSSNTGVATVDASGTTTAVGAGTATITATSEGKSASATLTVGAGPVASVSVSPSPVSLTVGQRTQLAATTRDASGNAIAGRSVVWSSSNTSIATVSAQGEVTGTGAGSTTITASSEGRSGAAEVTVSGIPVSSVTVSPPSSTLSSGQGTTLTATVRNQNGAVVNQPVSWTSSNPNVAAVNPSTGAVTTRQVGSATITAASAGVTGSATITVTPGAAAAVTVSPDAVTIKPNQKATLTATAVDANGNAISGRNFTWTTSQSTTSVVAPSIVVTPLRTGTITVTARLDNATDSAIVTVK